MKKLEFTTVEIYPKNRNMKVKWFVAFRCTDKTTGHTQQFQYRDKINSHKTKQERMIAARALSSALSDLIKSGWNPFEAEVQTGEQLEIKPLVQALREVLEIKRATFTPKSYISYNDILKQFTGWLKKKHLDIVYPDHFTNQHIRNFLDYCLTEWGNSGKTHNVKLNCLRALFNALKDRGGVKVNPCDGIKKLPEKSCEKVAFMDTEREAAKKHLFTNHRRLYYACQFVYYCMIRRTELMLLRVGDIDFESKTIRISGKTAKNGRSESVTIPRSFEPILYEMGLNTAPKDYYIFGKDFDTCPTRLVKADYLSDAHRAAMKEIDMRKESTFYSWKHTGAMQLYKATKDPYIVMRQCRHTDISITMIYLRSLGLVVNETVRNADFSF